MPPPLSPPSDPAPRLPQGPPVRSKFLAATALARAPRDTERATLTALLENQRARYTSAPDEAKKLVNIGNAPAAEDLDAIEVAAWTAVCRAVLNLHETLTRN